jgi:alkanesulfonate monooxygenase SsuD/methylene tetrahydromethanopterin reductase-like flavin-dependent oxidoreductase (luciferase family)
MRIGVALPQYRIDTATGQPWDAAVRIAAAAEQLGLDSIWLSDHPFAVGPDGVPSGALEPLATMAALARAVPRIRLGTLVLSSTMRAPALVAHTFASLEQLAPGRVTAGLGAGWYEPEHRAFGLRLPPYQQRVAGLDITARAIAGLGPGRRPSLLVGGTSPSVIELAARSADAHNVAWDLAPAAFDELEEKLDRACDRAGRDPTTLQRTVGLTVAVARDERGMNGAIARLRRRASFLAEVDRAALAERIILGTPQECAERIAAYRADEVVVALLLRDDAEMLELFATEVAPLLR